MAVTRNPMAGRHNVGGKTATPGATRGGQSAKARPITGTNTAMRPTPNVLTNQATTSEGAQRVVAQPPMPFQNRNNSLNVAAPTHSQFGSSGNAKEAQQRYGGGNKHSVHSGTSLDAEMMAAVGYEPKATRSDNPIISGNPFKGNQRQAGRPGNVNKGASAKDSQRVRQTGY